MSDTLRNDQEIRDFLEQYEQRKGEYDKDNYEKLVQVVTELQKFLEEANAGGVFASGRFIEKTGRALQDLGVDMWTGDETAKILNEALQKEESIQKGDA
jgi:hypothetical protein